MKILDKYPVVTKKQKYRVIIEEREYGKQSYPIYFAKVYVRHGKVFRWLKVYERVQAATSDCDFVEFAKNTVLSFEQELEKDYNENKLKESNIKKFNEWNGVVDET